MKGNWLGSLIVGLVFGLLVVSCDNGTTNNSNENGNGNGGENTSGVSLIIENNLTEGAGLGESTYGIIEFRVRQNDRDIHLCTAYNAYSETEGYYRRVLPGNSIVVDYFFTLEPGTYTIIITLKAGRLNPKTASCSFSIVSGKTTTIEVVGNNIARVKL
jgi:hypothetical protein